MRPASSGPLTNPQDTGRSLDPLTAVDTWGVRAAVGVTNATTALGSHGPADRAFRWASVTKLLSALAVLVAVEEGAVSLDQPAGPPGSTLRHLLAHASGLAFNGDEVLAAPASRRIYSNRGIEVAANAVERGAGIAFADYLGEGVLEPLQLGGTTLEGSPAWGARGPLTDLLALGREMLAPKLVSPELLGLATSVVFPGLVGVLPGYGRQAPNDWGLGFELRAHKHPHWTGATNSPETFGHFGQSGSFLWVDPVHALATAALADTDFGPWAVRAWPALSDEVIRAWGNPEPGTQPADTR